MHTDHHVHIKSQKPHDVMTTVISIKCHCATTINKMSHSILQGAHTNAIIIKSTSEPHHIFRFT